jgi:DNA-binding NarL/FixJ family response regulator
MIEKKNISIVIADDHPMLLKGIYEELTENGYKVVGQASNGEQALDLILGLNPSIALLDIEMPMLTGFEVIKKAKKENIDTKFIVLSFHKESDYISQAKALQINGYLLKEDSFSEIERCMECVLDNKTCFSRSFEESSLQNVSEELKKINHLTSSEKTILKLIVKQMSSSEIAKTLFISARTVEKHRSNIITKLELENTTNTLTNWALLNKNIVNEL